MFSLNSQLHFASPFSKGGLRGIFTAVPAFFKGHCYILPLFLKELQIFPPFVKGARGILDWNLKSAQKLLFF